MTEAESWVFDTDAQTFERDVIERSRTVPVVVDFWAEWCEPCKTLTPLLEQRARAGKGRFALARIDVDRNPELAQAFRVQALPSVLALSDGRIVDGFQGALPPEELDRFLERIAPGQAGVGAEAGAVADARARIDAGDAENAVALLRGHLREHPTDAEARILLAGTLADAGRGVEAEKVLAKLSEADQDSPGARSVRAKLELAASAGSLEEVRARVAADPGDFGARVELGRALVATGEARDGLETLFEVVQSSQPAAPPEQRDAARQAMLEAFELLGLEDPTANEYRFKLSMVLFA